MMTLVKVCPVCQREYADAAVRCADDSVPLVALVRDVHTRAEDLIGQIVEGRWKIERIIGKGGMGTVYACRHMVVGKIAAIKVLRTGPDKSDAVLQRFVREAQTANLLRSRHIVEVSDFGQLPSGAFFVVMELLEGQDFARAMRAGLSRRELVHVFTQVAETLQAAHEKGIVHRDLKPDNVYLVREGDDPLFVKLLDFGIAKIMHGDTHASGLTETGVILGTPYYMSPEQARAEAVDHRTDIYALGVMMYRAFTGRLPFMADSTMGVLTRHITETPQPPSQLQSMDAATEQTILRCLAKKPQYRFQSMRELADALRLVPLDAPIPSPQTYQGGASAQSQGGMGGSSGAFAAATPSAISGSGAYLSPQTPQPASAPTFTPRPHSTGHTFAANALPHAQPPPEPTTSGVAASAPVASRGSNGLLLAVGGLSTAAIGAVVALVVFGRVGVGPQHGAAPGDSSAPAVSVAVASTSAPTSASTSQPAAASASAPAPAPSEHPSAEPAATASAPRTSPSVAHVAPRQPPPPPLAPPSIVQPQGPKLPNGVRDPFQN